MPEKTIHYCTKCDYKSTRRWDRDRHMRSQHITQESIQHTYPNEDYNVNNIQNQHNSQYRSGSTHIPIEKHNEVVGIAHGWKKECEKMQEAYRLLQENFREAGENSHAIISYLQNVLNANNIRYNLDLA